MLRETKTIKTASGIEVVLHTYVTGRERRAITNVFMRDDLKEVEKYNQAQDLALKTIIVSIAGVTEGIVDKVLDMKDSDSKAIIKEVNAVTSDQSIEEKKS